ncbi:tetratricopeptide repeat protein [Rhodocyclus tenuis]|uniref:tetratricopeptide repeat protein n=1 Tax=Rhodocyclus gracilis TaxID=2929842 RepID=UPI001298C577|nr:tetratricopeptide repeat protein [Rhodocyclus gracilis]
MSHSSRPTFPWPPSQPLSRSLIRTFPRRTIATLAASLLGCLPLLGANAQGISAQASAAATTTTATTAAPAIPRPAPPRDTRQSAPRHADTAIHLQRNAPQAPPLLLRAYRALQDGQLDAAAPDYRSALARDPHDLDALLGLAHIATRRGDNEYAATLYGRALESDPGDADALAGLTALQGLIDPAQAESRLKSALDSSPTSASLHLALGGLMAEQQRWHEAQQAYFRALTLIPDNADILFNLAVCLDHLRQSQLAAQHYRRAMDLAGKSPATFDRRAVEQRLAELASS